MKGLGYGIALLLVLPALASAQGERYELGRRLRAFESAWDAQPDPAARKRAVPQLQRAVNSFFSLRLTEAGKALDEARFLLKSGEPAEPSTRWAESLYLQVDGRLIDVSVTAVPITLEEFYKTELAKPVDATLRISLLKGAKEPPVALAEWPITAPPFASKFLLKDMPPGDYALRAEVLVAGKPVATMTDWLSCVERLAARLEALEKTAGELPRDPASTEKETARSLTALLQSLVKNRVPETSYPAARLLAEAEAVAAAAKDGKEFYSKVRPGEFWLTVAADEKKIPIRLLVPEAAAKAKAVPLVLALHGAGGSENLFFDGYGNGAVARLCKERGWLLAAPRSSGYGGAPLTALVDELAQRYPVDRQRVFLVGHSMGAAQAVSTAGVSPERFAGVAALGGGGAARRSEALKKLPFFIGVGTEDFALRGARALRDSLKNAEVETLEFKEYPDVEHLVIVQVALPEVFQFFDKICSELRTKR